MDVYDLLVEHTKVLRHSRSWEPVRRLLRDRGIDPASCILAHVKQRDPEAPELLCQIVVPAGRAFQFTVANTWSIAELKQWTEIPALQPDDRIHTALELHRLGRIASFERDVEDSADGLAERGWTGTGRPGDAGDAPAGALGTERVGYSRLLLITGVARAVFWVVFIVLGILFFVFKGRPQVLGAVLGPICGVALLVWKIGRYCARGYDFFRGLDARQHGPAASTRQLVEHLMDEHATESERVVYADELRKRDRVSRGLGTSFLDKIRPGWALKLMFFGTLGAALPVLVFAVRGRWPPLDATLVMLVVNLPVLAVGYIAFLRSRQ